MVSPHSRLAGYTSSSISNLFSGSLPQAYPSTAASLQFQPITQPYSPQFQSQSQPTNEISAHSLPFRDGQNISPWNQSISPHWWQSNIPSFPSSQISSPQNPPRWGSLSPSLMPLGTSRPQSVTRQDIHPQVPFTLLPSITALNLETSRRGIMSYRGVQNPLRPLSQGSFSRGELGPSPTVSCFLPDV